MRALARHAPALAVARSSPTRGYIAATPIEVRQFYFESEVLVERGAFRTYMTASAACSDGCTIMRWSGRPVRVPFPPRPAADVVAKK